MSKTAFNKATTKSSFEKAKDFIIKAGFSHIKIEMEADLGREDCDYDCPDCYGDGYTECYECEGSGVVMSTRPNGSEIEVECDECNGEGRIECETCGGSGELSGERWDVDNCKEWILDYVSSEAREVLTYSEFYYDGSVDSEMTLTLPVKNADYLIEYLEAFKALSDEIGNGLNTGGAGMHITVLPNGKYPTGVELPSDKLDNFKSEVTKLLPALYMLASSDGVSRGLSYRKPQIKYNEKYSAVYAYDRSSLEYRIFETCYDNPEMIKEYIEVIANTLKYYDNPELKVPTLNKRFDFMRGSHRVSRFYQNTDNIKILRDRLKYIKPEGRSISELMKSREVPNITELNKANAAKRKQLRKEWYDNEKRHKTLFDSELEPRQISGMEEYIRSGYNEIEAKNMVLGIRKQRPLQLWIADNFRASSEYSLTV